MLAAPVSENGPARRAAVLGAATELAAVRVMRHRLGEIDEVYRSGRPARLMRAAEVLTAAGAAGALLVGRRGRLGAAVSGLALMAGSACTRFGVFEAGRASARDPKYTVGPQRSRTRDDPAGVVYQSLPA
jgi:hypothetical protein